MEGLDTSFMNISQQDIAVVVPVYRYPLLPSEQLAWEQCLRVLGHYPIVVVHPQSLSISEMLQGEVRSLPLPHYRFKDIAAYNRLLTDVDFYALFDAYEYILIHQLDAYVFEDELFAWCQKGYDYIGSPGFPEELYYKMGSNESDEWAAALRRIPPLLNGGFSLRRIKAMKRFLRIHNTFFPTWVGNEDMLFSLFAKRLGLMRPFIHLPHWSEALRFGFEKSPRASFVLTKEQLPFGCHAWERYDPDFWTDYIPQP